MPGRSGACVCALGGDREARTRAQKHGHGGVSSTVRRFRTYARDSGSETTGKRREQKEGLTGRCSLSSFRVEVDGDDEESKMFSTVRGRGRSEATAWRPPVLGLGVVGVEEEVGFTPVCSAEPTVLHGAPAKTEPNPTSSSKKFRKEQRQRRGKERGAAAERRERTRVCSGARRGALMGAKAAPAGPCWRWGGARLRCCLSAQRYRGDDGGARAGLLWAAQPWVVGGP